MRRKASNILSEMLWRGACIGIVSALSIPHPTIAEVAAHISSSGGGWGGAQTPGPPKWGVPSSSAVFVNLGAACASYGWCGGLAHG